MRRQSSAGTAHELSENLAGSPSARTRREEAKKRILKIASTASYKGITRNELTRKTQFIRRSMREEYLEDLLDSGEVVMREQISGRNHVQVYFLASLAPKEA